MADTALGELENRSDLCLVRVSNAVSARALLRDLGIDLVLVCPDDSRPLGTIVDETRALQAGIPVLALCSDDVELTSDRGARLLGFLRLPVLPDVLNRSVDIALGLRSATAH
jgi:hypothetical protein